MGIRVAFTGKQALCLESFSDTTLQPDEVRVKGLCSMMSTGTENIVYNRLFESGTSWDGWVKYPFYPGYSFIGEVAEVGKDVQLLSVGERVAARAGHASSQVIRVDQLMKVPGGISSEVAAWFALSKITYVGASVAHYVLGDDEVDGTGGNIEAILMSLPPLATWE